MPRKSAAALEERAAPEHTISEEKDESLLEAATTIFAEDIEPPEEEPDLSDTPPIDEPQVPLAPRREVDPETGEIREVQSEADWGKPGIDKMITVRGGGLYLPVRRRVVWMRGEPKQHPLWTIDTVAEKVIEGTFKKGTSRSDPDRVEGGYARYRANIFDESGRLIASGTKTEFSERFLDFAEKAETGAIGRALAVAGFGTEAAVDLDEGLEQERIADAPVAHPGRPINITPSAIPGISAGGRSESITEAQLHEVARLARALDLGAGLVTMLETVSGRQMPPLSEDGGERAQNQAMLDFLRGFSFDEAADLIQRLNAALSKHQKESK